MSDELLPCFCHTHKYGVGHHESCPAYYRAVVAKQLLQRDDEIAKLVVEIERRKYPASVNTGTDAAWAERYQRGRESGLATVHEKEMKILRLERELRNLQERTNCACHQGEQYVPGTVCQDCFSAVKENEELETERADNNLDVLKELEREKIGTLHEIAKEITPLDVTDIEHCPCCNAPRDEWDYCDLCRGEPPPSGE